MNQILSIINIERHLKEVIGGDVYFDDLNRALYAKAACMYQEMPMGVVLPMNEQDVSALVSFAYENKIPLIGRGSGSSLNGQVIGAGIVVDFTKYMNKILKTGNDYAIVQPGVILGQLNKRLKSSGKMFSPDPSSGNYATIGGMIGNNSSGAHSIKYGATKAHIRSLRVVLSNGDVACFEKTLLDSRLSGLEGTIYSSLFDLLVKNDALIKEKTPDVAKNSSGYNLRGVLEGDTLDITKLIVGSEGTLGLVTEAKLNLTKIPEYKALILIYFKSLENAGEVINKIMEEEPSALEIMAKHFLALVKEDFPEIPSRLEAALLVEYDGSQNEVIDRIEWTKQIVADLSAGFKTAYDMAEQEKLWQFRKSATLLLNKIPGSAKPISVIEDVVVGPSKITGYINEINKILQCYGVEAAIHGHAGDGNFHIKPLLDYRNPADLKKIENISAEVFNLAIKMGGTLSGEHGDGLARTQFLEKLYGQKMYALFKRTKSIFDPRNILNPGKIINDAPNTIIKNIRKPLSVATDSYLDDEAIIAQIDTCQGCGNCKTFCPPFKILLDESSLSRGRANVLSAIKDGTLPKNLLQSDELRKLFDSCFNCHRCTVECPAGADIAKLVLLEKTRYADSVRNTFKGKIDFYKARIICVFEMLGKFGGPAINPLLEIWPLRLLAEKTIGMSSKIKPPKFEASFASWYQKHEKINSLHKVAYFHGCFANYSNTDISKSLVYVLAKNGIEVVVPEQNCCNIALIGKGYINSEHVQKAIRRNIVSLQRMIEEGMEIVTGCPSCVHALKVEYPNLLKGELLARTNIIKEHVHDIGSYLINLKEAGQLKAGFKKLDINATVHIPCHLKAIGADEATMSILDIITDLKNINDSCCGMGGTFGLNHYEQSHQIGADLFDEISGAGVEYVITNCGACRLQIQQGTGVKILHPIEVLALGC